MEEPVLDTGAAPGEGPCSEEASPEFTQEKIQPPPLSNDNAIVNGDSECVLKNENEENIDSVENKESETNNTNEVVTDENLSNENDLTESAQDNIVSSKNQEEKGNTGSMENASDTDNIIVENEDNEDDKSIDKNESILTENLNDDKNEHENIKDNVSNENIVKGNNTETEKDIETENDILPKEESPQEILLERAPSRETSPEKESPKNKLPEKEFLEKESPEKELLENKEKELPEKENDDETTSVVAIQNRNLEPVSPGMEGLSPEREEDFEDDEEEEEDTKVELGPRYSPKAPVLTIQPLKNMLEDIEDGELDYDEDGQIGDGIDDLPDLPEYNPSIKKHNEDGEICSDNNDDEDREEGEIRDEDETGEVYICVDSKSDRWKKATKAEQKRLQELEEGQIEDDEPTPEPEVNNKVRDQRFIPRTLCKYFNNGLCRWGETCRFLHPGINDKGNFGKIPIALQLMQLLRQTRTQIRGVDKFAILRLNSKLNIVNSNRPALTDGAFGIPKDSNPAWNSSASGTGGNYAMLRPPGLYPNAYGKAPPAMECVNGPVIPTTAKVESEMSIGIIEASPKPESAWEKGLRRAKEIKEAAARRRQEDVDFEDKRMNMRIPEYFPSEREPENFDTAPIDNGPAKMPLHYEHDHRNGGGGDLPGNNENTSSSNFHYDRNRGGGGGGRYQPQAENKLQIKNNDRFHVNNKMEKDVDRSSGRARLAELPPSHPLRREERQRQREREKRRDRDDSRGPERRDPRDPRDENKPPPPMHNNKLEQTDPRRQSSYPPSQAPGSVPPPPPPHKSNSQNATEWHDPWMRTQTGPMAGLKPNEASKSGLEAVSDSSSSDSDSDSDSDSSSSSKSSSSDSDSDSSGDEKQRKNKTESSFPRRDNKPRVQSEVAKINKPPPPPPPRDEPLSYNEWKKQQSIQKSQQQQQQQPQHHHNHHSSQQHGSQHGSHYNRAPANRDNRDSSRESRDSRYNRDAGRSSSVKRPSSDVTEHHHHQHGNNRTQDPRTGSSNSSSVNNNSSRRNESAVSRSSVDTSSKKAPVVPKNDDKFDSPKRKANEASDSSDSSDSDSDSDSDSSDSDSSDSDSDAGAKKSAAAKPTDKLAPKLHSQTALKPAPPPAQLATVDPATATAAAGMKRPARKDDLLKELKAVEDAIARKRAKID